MATKKQPVKRAKSLSPSGAKSSEDPVSIDNNELRIKFSDSHDLLEKLFGVTHAVSRRHTQQLVAGRGAAASIAANPLDHFSVADIAQSLGPSKATDIVCKCADETDITKTIGDLGLEPLIFQNCVQRGVLAAGYQPNGIPASASTTLSDVIVAIQGSPPK